MDTKHEIHQHWIPSWEFCVHDLFGMVKFHEFCERLLVTFMIDSVWSPIEWVGNVIFQVMNNEPGLWRLYFARMFLNHVALTTFSKTCSRRFGRISHFLGHWFQICIDLPFLCQTSPVSNRTTTWTNGSLEASVGVFNAPNVILFLWASRAQSLNSKFYWLLEDYLRDHHPIFHFPNFLEMITGKSHSHLPISQDWRGHILEFGIFEEQNSELPALQ